MGLLELLAVAVGLSMDAFAVSICKGLSVKRVSLRQMLIVGLYFGGFQALMPYLGYLLGSSFSSLVASVDHWIAFGLLAFLGLKTILEAVREKDEECVEKTESVLDIKELFLMAIATSIDALAVGITFAFLQVRILEASGIIGIVTFIICVFGVFVGNIFGSRFKKKAAVAGGVILILIGARILLDHLGVF